MGAIVATFAGFAFAGLPLFIHLPLAILFGFLGGALWGAIPGILKARTGAHEVIVTIMLNYVAYRLIDILLKNQPLPADRTHRTRSPRSSPDSARHARLHRRPAGRTGGSRSALLAALARVVAAVQVDARASSSAARRPEPLARARYAGISVGVTIVLTMVDLAAASPGLAGASVMLASRASTLTPGFSPGLRLRRDRHRPARPGRRPAGVVARRAAVRRPARRARPRCRRPPGSRSTSSSSSRRS